MSFLAKVTGTYRYRVRIKILWFWIVQPWKTVPFAWERQVDAPEIHLAYSPAPGIPLSIALDLDESSAHFGLKLTNGPELWGHTVSVPAGVEQPFNFEPWKGVILNGTAKFEEIPAAS
jgi:hypothetical protein